MNTMNATVATTSSTRRITVLQVSQSKGIWLVAFFEAGIGPGRRMLLADVVVVDVDRAHWPASAHAVCRFDLRR